MPDLEALDPRRTALVVVDMQNDFCSPGGFFDRAGHDIGPCAELVPRLTALVATARRQGVALALTMTVREEPHTQVLRPARHPADRGSAAAATLGRDRYARGAWGTDIVPDLRPLDGDLVVEKPRQSAFYRTALEQSLRERGIDTLAVAGVTTNCCVDTTVRDAYMRDFDVLVLRDGVAAFGGERHLHDASLENLALFFAVVTDARSFLQALGQPVA